MFQLDKNDIEFINRTYQLDDKLLNEAIKETKRTLEYICGRISTKYCTSQIPFFKNNTAPGMFCISGNSIATLIRNFYLNPAEARNKYLKIVSSDMFVRDIDDGYESDIDIYFHKCNESLHRIGYTLKHATNALGDDVFFENIKLADKDSGCEYGPSSEIKEGDYVITDNAITMKDGTQFILCCHGEGFTDSFDFEHCKMRFDGNNLFASKLQLICAIYKLMLYKKASDNRILKYTNRGFNSLNVRLDMNRVRDTVFDTTN